MGSKSGSYRNGKIERVTRETEVKLEFEVEGSGVHEISTGIGMLDHLLDQIPRHGVFDLRIGAKGKVDPDKHHVVEDIGICLGQAINKALGDRAGIRRMGHSVVPLDEALVMVAIDIGGRPYAVIEAPFEGVNIGDLPGGLIRHFFEALAVEARMNIHVKVIAGIDDHHRSEALFKAFGRALDEACSLDGRIGGDLPSTKGSIEV